MMARVGLVVVLLGGAAGAVVGMCAQEMPATVPNKALDYGTVTSPEGDTLVAFRGELLVAQLAFDYQYAVRDWLGIYAEFMLRARTGTDGASLLRTGVNYGTSFEVGWLAQLRERERSLLSGSFFLARREVSNIDPVGFGRDAVGRTGAGMLTETPSLRVGLTAHYALALNRVLGVYAAGTASFGESRIERETDWLFGIVGGVSLDLEPEGVPLGVGVTVRADGDASPVGVETGPWQAVGIRFTYTRPADMQLSLISNFNRVPFTDQRNMTVTEVGLEMRYYFF
jgi:hypothetical protein